MKLRKRKKEKLARENKRSWLTGLMKMSKLYLYDARYNLKKETSYSNIASLLKKNVEINKTQIKKDFYIIDDNVTKDQLIEMYGKVKYKNEAWTVVEGSDNKFLVSTQGRFKKITKTNPDGIYVMPKLVERESKKNRNKNTLFIHLTFKGERKLYIAARIVAYHFVDIFYDARGIGGGGKPLKYKNMKHEELIVYHKNGLAYDNYCDNLEWIDRIDFNKKMSSSKGNRLDDRIIVARDAKTREIIDEYNSLREAARNLPISQSSVHRSIKCKAIVGGMYIFEDRR
ncbi:MAG: hypothetical protein ACRCX2_33680 [Paraclostridium sp.]